MRMEITLELLEEIAKQYEQACGFKNRTQLARFFYEKLSAVADITNKLSDLDRKEKDKIENHRAELEAIDSQRAKVVSNCSHLLKKHYPDASGNNDSFWRCEICKKEIG